MCLLVATVTSKFQHLATVIHGLMTATMYVNICFEQCRGQLSFPGDICSGDITRKRADYTKTSALVYSRKLRENVLNVCGVVLF